MVCLHTCVFFATAGGEAGGEAGGYDRYEAHEDNAGIDSSRDEKRRAQ